ncbi:unnamed protein product, partial [Timema podura]|nr:unnamed protein product [Timema podura]
MPCLPAHKQHLGDEWGTDICSDPESRRPLRGHAAPKPEYPLTWHKTWQYRVSNRSRHIFKDAVDGQGVTECSSLACLSNPCYSAATCVEYKDHWHCLCPSGYVGVRCERSVCSNNPCMFGATCVVFTASGFLCLCPLGKHGVYCEHDVDVAQPQFWSSVGGLSSYAAYQLPGTIHNSLELKLRFSPTTMDQIALLVFVGQEGLHTVQSDHLALSFIKGYLVLTWNLGSG